MRYQGRVDASPDGGVDAERGTEFRFPLAHAFTDGVREIVQAVGQPSHGPVQALGAEGRTVPR